MDPLPVKIFLEHDDSRTWNVRFSKMWPGVLARSIFLARCGASKSRSSSSSGRGARKLCRSTAFKYLPSNYCTEEGISEVCLPFYGFFLTHFPCAFIDWLGSQLTIWPAEIWYWYAWQALRKDRNFMLAAVGERGEALASCVLALVFHKNRDISGW